MVLKEMDKRDASFDIMKGIGILLMLIGHLQGIGYARHIIYSFHMPMFFIVAGFFSKSYNPIEKWHIVWKYIKRLLKPIYFTYAILLLYLIGVSLAKHDFSHAIRQLIRMIWASGAPLHTKWGTVHVGVAWFVFALFWAKVSLFLLSKWPKLVLPVSFALSIAFMLFHHHITEMVPFCILLGLVALPFVAVGWWQRQYGFPCWVKWAAVVIWPLAIAFSDIELYGCYMKWYPLGFIGACGGTIVVYYLSKWISKVYFPKVVLGYLGVVSMAIICMYEFVDWGDIINTLFIHSPWENLRHNYFINVTVKYSLILGSAFVITKMPLIKKIYV